MAAMVPQSAMPQSVYFAVVLHMTTTRGRPFFTYIQRADLHQEAEDLLAFTTTAACAHRAAAVRLALRLFLTYQLREAYALETFCRRECHRQRRALNNVPSLTTHDPITVRVRQLVREHVVMTETLSALLRDHPELRTEAARHQQRAELQFTEDPLSGDSDLDEM
jgi:hypothetical protein